MLLRCANTLEVMVCMVFFECNLFVNWLDFNFNFNLKCASINATLIHQVCFLKRAVFVIWAAVNTPLQVLKAVLSCSTHRNTHLHTQLHIRITSGWDQQSRAAVESRRRTRIAARAHKHHGGEHIRQPNSSPCRGGGGAYI